MRTISPLALAAAALLMLGFTAPTFAQQMTFETGSKIWVEGTSNIHDWSCDAAQIESAVTADLNDGALVALEATTVRIPLAQLDCDSGQMNRRMRSALNADSHPNISFQLSEARVGQPSDGQFLAEAGGRLTINGTTQTVQFRANGEVLPDGRFRLSGEVPITISDYGIDPPTAMLGALRTSDNATVHFDVTLR